MRSRAVNWAPQSILLALSFAAVPDVAAAQSTSWTVRDFNVEFEIRNAGLPVHGTFETLEATVEFDPADPAGAMLKGSVDPTSIDTGIRLRDRHLAGRQFFHAREFPQITMESQRIRATGDGSFVGSFRLRIRDIEQTVDVPFEFSSDGDVSNLEGTLTIDRTEFGLGDHGFILSDDVQIRVLVALERTD